MSIIGDLVNATAYEVTDAPRCMAVEEKMRSPYRDKRTRVQARDKKLLNLAAWNVRTTNDSQDSIRPERATAIICREIEKANVDICALSEVRRPDSGNIKEKSHTIFWSGGAERHAGVGFAISNNFDHITPVPINDRLMTVRIPLKDNNYLTLISVYAPTMQRTTVEKESFYEKLSDCIDKAKGDSIIVLGDFNARVGKDWQLESTELKNEFKWLNATGILHSLSPFNHGNHVPVERSSQKYLATLALKTLAPNRSCTS